MNLARIVVSVLAGTLLLLAGTAFSAEAPGLPSLPAHAVEMGVQPIAHCGGNYGVYVRYFDLAPDQPDNPASAAVYGLFESREDSPVFHDPVLVIIRDAQGNDRLYLREAAGAVEVTLAELVARYPEPCSLPGIVPRREA